MQQRVLPREEWNQEYSKKEDSDGESKLTMGRQKLDYDFLYNSKSFCDAFASV